MSRSYWPALLPSGILYLVQRSMWRRNIENLCYMALCLFLLGSCNRNEGSPKPRGFYRIEFPEKAYKTYLSACPFSFDYPVYARIVKDSSSGAEPCWLNMEFPRFNGTLHISYKEVKSPKMFRALTEDAHEFAYKHSVKATDIEETPIGTPGKHVYGIFYEIDGNAASSAQFYLTDSTKHYLRGALYFNLPPRIDSIRPVLDFIKIDIDRMIRTLRWKS